MGTSREAAYNEAGSWGSKWICVVRNSKDAFCTDPPPPLPLSCCPTTKNLALLFDGSLLSVTLRKPSYSYIILTRAWLNQAAKPMFDAFAKKRDV